VSADAAKLDPALLAGLRKAFASAEPCPLKGAGERPLFPGGQKGTQLAEAAQRHEFLTVRKIQVPSGRRSKSVEVGELTDKGRRAVLEADSPNALLEALLPTVQALADRKPDEPDLTALRSECDKATRACVSAIEKAFGALQKSVQAAGEKLEQAVVKAAAAAASRPAAPVDGAPLLGALRAAIEKSTAALSEAHNGPRNPPSSVPAAPAEELDGAIVAAVDDWVRDHPVGCPFDALWERLRPRRPGLSIGAFHDALRRLADAGRLRLSGWPKMLDDMPAPQLALFVSSKVMYYAHPIRSAG
jgi:hypothetical protein